MHDVLGQSSVLYGSIGQRLGSKDYHASIALIPKSSEISNIIDRITGMTTDYIEEGYLPLSHCPNTVPKVQQLKARELPCK